VPCSVKLLNKCETGCCHGGRNEKYTFLFWTPCCVVERWRFGGTELKFRRNVLSISWMEVDRGRIFLKYIPNFPADYGVISQMTVFLDAFAKLRKATISFVMSVCLSVCLSVCPSVRIEQLAFYGKDFHEILYFIILRKAVE
jgi:hypothetical protein